MATPTVETLARPFWQSRMALEIKHRRAPKREAIALDAVRFVAGGFAAEMAHACPDFDRAAFLKACGFEGSA